MKGNRNRHTRPLTLIICFLLTSVFLMLTVFAVVPENGNHMQSHTRDNQPIAGAVTDGADAIGDAVTDAGNAIGEIVSDVGDAAGDIVSDAGDAVGGAVGAIGSADSHRGDNTTGAVGGNAGGREDAPSSSAVTPYESQNAPTAGTNGTTGSMTETNRTDSFNWIWILILTAAAAAIFFLLLMPGRRRQT